MKNVPVRQAPAVTLISIASIGAAVVTLQESAPQAALIAQTVSSSKGTIGRAVKQFLSTGEEFHTENDVPSLGDICKALCIPATVERLNAIVSMMQVEKCDWQTAFSNTLESAIKNDDKETGAKSNKTAAYNTAKQARSLTVKALKAAAEAEKAAAEQAERQRIAAIEAEQQAAINARQAAEQQAREKAAEQALSEVETLRQQVASLKAEVAFLQSELAAAQAGSKPAKAGKGSKVSA